MRCLHSHGPTAKRKWQNMRGASGDSQCVNVATFAPLWLAKHSGNTHERTHSHTSRQPYWGINFKRFMRAAKGYKIFIVSCCMANDKQTIRTNAQSQEGEAESSVEVASEATAECNPAGYVAVMRYHCRGRDSQGDGNMKYNL